MEFTAVKDFHCAELKSDYVAGLTYTARSPDDPAIKADTPLAKIARANRTTLQKLLPTWVKEGKVVMGRVTVSPGVMSGAGKVH